MQQAVEGISPVEDICESGNKVKVSAKVRHSSDSAVAAAWHDFMCAVISYEDYGDIDDPECPWVRAMWRAEKRLVKMRPAGLAGMALHLRLTFIHVAIYQGWAQAIVFDRAAADWRKLEMADQGLIAIWRSIENIERLAS